MRNIIIYGCGKMYARYATRLKNCNILAAADKKLRSNAETGCGIISPENIRDYDYDYVAISSFAAFESIKQQLIGENGIPADRIVSMRLFIDEFEPGDMQKANRLNTEQKKLLKALRAGGDVFSVEGIDAYEELKKADPDITWYSCAYQMLGTKRPAAASDDCSIYVVTHKEYALPEDDLYKPITVGDYRHEGWECDSTGDDIACLNGKINECTAMYWVWKNSTAATVGINHYRRYFYNNEFKCRENMLDESRIGKLLNDHDLIAYHGQVPNGMTVEEEMCSTLDDEVYKIARDILLEEMRLHQPEYTEALNRAFAGHDCYYCNMLVAPKGIYDKYCEWLFSFLIPAAERMDVNGLDANNRRVMGFLAERMLTVWLSEQDYRVAALPVYIP